MAGEVAAMPSTSLGGYGLILLFVFEEAERVEQHRGVDSTRATLIRNQR